MLKELKKSLTPPYAPKELYSIFITLFIVMAVPLTVMLVTLSRDYRSSASVVGNANVKILNLKEGDTIKGSKEVQVEALSQDSAITSITLFVDDKQVAIMLNPLNSNSFVTNISLDSQKFKNGSKTIRTVAQIAGSETQATFTLVVNFENTDKSEPVISFEGVYDGESISGSKTLSINASDNSGIENVTLTLDSQVVREFSQPPYSYDLGGVEPGMHTVTASAIDLFGNVQTTQIKIYKTHN